MRSENFFKRVKSVVFSGSAAAFRFLKRNFRAVFFLALLAAAAPIILLVFKVTIYLGVGAMLSYAALFVLCFFVARLAKTRAVTVRAFSSSPAVAALHIVIILLVRIFIISPPCHAMIYLTALLVFFLWATFKLLFRNEKYRKAVRTATGFAGWAAAFAFMILYFPYPMNYLPAQFLIAGLLFCGLWRLLRLPWRRPLAAFTYSGLPGGLTVAVLLFSATRQSWLAMFVFLIPIFELAFALGIHRRLRGIFFFTVIMADALIPALLVGKLFSAAASDVVFMHAVSIIGFLLFSGCLFILNKIKTIKNSAALKPAYVAAAFIVTASAMNIVFHKMAVCDYEKIEKDFIVLSRKAGAYDSVLEPGGRYLFAIHGEDVNAVEKIDTSGIGKTKVFRFAGESQPQRLVYDTKRGRIAVANWGEDSMKVLVMDARTFKPVKIFHGDEIKGKPDNITMDPGHDFYYVLSEDGGEVVKIDARTLKITAKGRSEMGVAYGICYDRHRKSVFTGSWLGFYISELSAGNLRNKGRIRGSFVNYGIECDPASGKLFASNPLWNCISIYGGEKMSFQRSYPAGFGVRDIQLDDANNLIVAGSYFQGMLDLIELSTGKRIARWKPAPYIRGIYYDPSSGRIFTACKCGVLELKKRYNKTGGLK